MRTKMKWMLSFMVVIFAFTAQAQTKAVRPTKNPEMAFVLKPSIEKRMQRTENRKKLGNLPAHCKTPMVIRKTKEK